MSSGGGGVPDFRCLVTGSRRLVPGVHGRWVRETLLAVTGPVDVGRRLVLIHGAHPRGADAMADVLWPWLCRHLGRAGDVERVPAEWDRPCDARCVHRVRGAREGCRSAGGLRNAVMVDRGADVCVPFALPGSRGTGDCVRRARAAGIAIYPTPRLVTMWEGRRRGGT